MMYLTAIVLPSVDSSTVHIYTQTVHRTTQFTNLEQCGPCPVFARYTLAFALQLREKHGKTSVRVAGDASWHDENRVCDFVLSNYSDKHTITRLPKTPFLCIRSQFI